MRNKDFSSLTLKQKISFLQDNGSFLTTRFTENYYVKLYSLASFYVEVWSNSHLPWQDIVKISILDSYSRLSPYLPHVYTQQLLSKK